MRSGFMGSCDFLGLGSQILSQWQAEARSWRSQIYSRGFDLAG